MDGIAALAEVTVDLALHHLALSCDELTLSVCGLSEGAALSLTFYDVRTFMNKVTALVTGLYCSSVLDIVSCLFQVRPVYVGILV